MNDLQGKDYAPRLESESELSPRRTDTSTEGLPDLEHDQGAGLTWKWFAVVGSGILALGLVGYAVSSPSPAPAPSPGFDAGTKCETKDLCVSIVTDPTEMRRLIEGMPQLSAEQKQRLSGSAASRDIEMLAFRINQTFPHGETYEVQTDIFGPAGHMRYMIGASPQSFVLPATRYSPSFNFEAVASPLGTLMSGSWTTPAGLTPYQLTPGTAASSLPVRL